MGKEQELAVRDLRDGMARISLVPQRVPLAGGVPFIVVHEGPAIVSPSPYTQAVGQTTHE